MEAISGGRFGQFPLNRGDDLSLYRSPQMSNMLKHPKSVPYTCLPDFGKGIGKSFNHFKVGHYDYALYYVLEEGYVVQNIPHNNTPLDQSRCFENSSNAQSLTVLQCLSIAKCYSVCPLQNYQNIQCQCVCFTSLYIMVCLAKLLQNDKP